MARTARRCAASAARPIGPAGSSTTNEFVPGNVWLDHAVSTPEQERQAGRSEAGRPGHIAGPRRSRCPAKSTRSMCWWYQIVTAGRSRRTRPDRGPGLGLGGRARAGIERRVGDPLPAIGEVAVEVDAIGVLPGVGGGAVRVHLGHDPELDAGRDRLAAERRGDRQTRALVPVDAADHENRAARSRWEPNDQATSGRPCTERPNTIRDACAGCAATGR